MLLEVVQGCLGKNLMEGSNWIPTNYPLPNSKKLYIFKNSTFNSLQFVGHSWMLHKQSPSLKLWSYHGKCTFYHRSVECSMLNGLCESPLALWIAWLSILGILGNSCTLLFFALIFHSHFPKKRNSFCERVFESQSLKIRASPILLRLSIAWLATETLEPIRSNVWPQGES